MDKGKLLAEGSGKGHKEITNAYISGLIILASIIASVFFFVINPINSEIATKKKQITHKSSSLPYPSESNISKIISASLPLQQNASELKNSIINSAINELKTDRNVIMFGVALLIIAGIVAMCQYSANISKNAIKVYENSIEGSSYSFNIASMFKLTDFLLPYNQISSVDVEGNGRCLVVNGSNAKYKIYMMNAKEIRDAIASRKV
ncbi:MAG: hypothetical protein LBI42_07195 [Chitinispirillales bacterium]|jgi:hypothetical protein|nr:hypothetical protein [Chitinispirillales bacterium]